MVTVVFFIVFLLVLAALLLVWKELKAARKQTGDAHAQLVNSAKMASIGQLAGSVAHEINNPLIGVLNNIQLVKLIMSEKKEFSPAEFSQILDAIEDSALRCAKITRSLLDFSRSPKGVYEKVSLNEIVDKAAGLLQFEMKSANITLDKQLTEGIPAVSADPVLLQQAIFDLLNNARWAIDKKSHRQGGTIKVKTAFELSRRQAIILISDNGMGMSELELKKVFQPFFTTKPEGEGTGLGLSIVHRIVSDHKGKIEVESKLGEGSVFKIRLPVL